MDYFNGARSKRIETPALAKLTKLPHCGAPRESGLVRNPQVNQDAIGLARRVLGPTETQKYIRLEPGDVWPLTCKSPNL